MLRHPHVKNISVTVKLWKTPNLNWGKRTITSAPATKITTVNDRELKKFDEIHEDWWDTTGPMLGLHMFNNLRVNFIRDELLNARNVDRRPHHSDDRPVNVVRREPFPLKGFKIADVGCGAGILSESLVKLGAEVTGIDAAPELIMTAREHANSNPSISAAVVANNLKYCNETVDEHAGRHARKYDAIVCSEVIEHVNEKEFFIESCVELVKNGGSLIFTTVNRTLAAWASVIFWSENIVKKIPKGTHQYSMFITPEEMEKILSKNGCFMRTLQGTCAKPNLQEFFYTDTLQFCYAMHAIKK